MKLHETTVHNKVDDEKEENNVPANPKTVKKVVEIATVENIVNGPMKEFLKCEKHSNTKYKEQKCNVCDKKLENAMDLINHKAQERSNLEIQIRDTKAQDIKKATQENEVNEETSHPGEAEFQCDKCKRIVQNQDTFDKHRKKGLGKTCTLCSTLNYGKN